MLNEWALKHGVSAAAMQELKAMWHPQSLSGHNGVIESEGMIQNQLRVAASANGHMLLRNNSGACVDQTGRQVRYGLGNDSKRLNDKIKSSDLIGITLERAKYVGQEFGVFTAIEVKPTGFTGPKNDRERAQAAFITTVKAFAGRAMFCDNVHIYEQMIGAN